jgi:BED zinc finger
MTSTCKRGGGSASIVWNYFDYGETKNKVNCRECKQELSYNRQTSAMKEHLKRKHVHVNFAKLADGDRSLHEVTWYFAQS